MWQHTIMLDLTSSIWIAAHIVPMLLHNVIRFVCIFHVIFFTLPVLMLLFGSWLLLLFTFWDIITNDASDFNSAFLIAWLSGEGENEITILQECCFHFQSDQNRDAVEANRRYCTYIVVCEYLREAYMCTWTGVQKAVITWHTENKS